MSVSSMPYGAGIFPAVFPVIRSRAALASTPWCQLHNLLSAGDSIDMRIATENWGERGPKSIGW